MKEQGPVIQANALAAPQSTPSSPYGRSVGPARPRRLFGRGTEMVAAHGGHRRPGKATLICQAEMFVRAVTKHPGASAEVCQLSAPHWELLWLLRELHGPSLECPTFAHFCLVLRSPEQDPGLQFRPHPGLSRGKGPLPRPAGSVLPTTAEDTLGPRCCKGTVPPSSAWCPPVPGSFCAELLSSGWLPAHTCARGGASPRALLVELHEVPVGPFLQPVKVPLEGSMTL